MYRQEVKEEISFERSTAAEPEIALAEPLGAGAYTQIVEIVAPSSAVVGQRVDVQVKIKNNYASSILILCAVIIDGIYFERDNEVEYWVSAGATQSFLGHFPMPNESITIKAKSYYLTSTGTYYLDDEKTKNVTMAESYKGTITKKEMDYQDSWRSLPLYNIPQGTGVRVRITGRNDMASSQRMGIWWQAKDPGGAVVQEYSKWETFGTSAGGTQEFVGGSFNLSKVGTYRINVQLFMNPSDQVLVDDYSGTLCTVAEAVPESEFSGFAITQYTK